MNGIAADELTIVSGTPFTIETAGTYVFTFSAEGAQAKTITVTVAQAQTDPVTYTLSYAVGTHAGADVTAPAQQTEEEGNVISLPAALVGAFGYRFDGWNDGQTTYEAEASYTVSQNATFTAQWEFVGDEYQDAQLDQWGNALESAYPLADGESLVLSAKLSGEMSATAWEEGVFVQINDGATQYYFRPANTWWSGAYREMNPNGLVTRDFESLPDLIGHDAFNELKQDTRIVVTRTGSKIDVTYDFGIVVVGFTIENVTEASSDVYFILYDLAAEPSSGDTDWITASNVSVEWLPAVQKPEPDPAILVQSSSTQISAGEKLTLTWRATHEAQVNVAYTKDGEAASALTPVSGTPFVISEAGTYVFTFTAQDADAVIVTVTVTEAKPNLVTQQGWTLPSVWQQNGTGLVNENNNGNAANVNWLSNYAVLDDAAPAGDYSLSVTFRGTRTNHEGTAGNNIEIGVIPWYLDAQNYVIVYLQFWPNWAYSAMGLTSIEVLYFRDGVRYGAEGVQGFNSHFMDNPLYSGSNCASLNPDDEITIKVDKVFDGNMDVFTVTVSGTNTDGNYVSVSFEQAYSISVSHRAETAAVGLYSWNDTVTFSSLTVDSIGSDTEEGTAQQSADLPKKEEL